VISGGTGLTKNDVTIEAISSISEFEITAFSTIFSLLSYEEIGTSAIMSRSSAFVVDRKPVFCLPGSPKAAELGVKKIVLEQIDHIHHELNR
jgi:molybdenum cofactor biosynthesis protein B